MTGKLDRMLREGRAPEVLIRRYLEGQLDAPNIVMKGFVKWELVRNGRVIRDSGGFHPNVITNVGMDSIGAYVTIDTATTQAKVGTGSAAPAITDVNLQTPIGTAVTRSAVLSNTYTAGPPDYWARQHQYKFLEANANGNLTEFGTFNSATMFSRQLLKDGTGTPTTITKTATDQLWITYEIRLYPPTVDVNSVVTISAVNYDVTTRPMQVNGASAWGAFIWAGLTTQRAQTKESNALLSRTAASDFGNQDQSTIVDTAYVSGNYYIETQTVWDITNANYPSGIGAIAHFYGSNSGFSSSYQMFQHVFVTTKIPKTNTKKLTLFLRRSWGRYP